MIDNEDPIIAALAEQDDKLDWHERTGLCQKSVVAWGIRSLNRVRGAVFLKSIARIVARMFISANS